MDILCDKTQKYILVTTYNCSSDKGQIKLRELYFFMCEFCVQHGAGKKWFMNAQNYAEKLAETEDREVFIRNLFTDYGKKFDRNVRKTDLAFKLPVVKGYASRQLERYYNEKHSGQVISLEDAINICSIPERVSIIDCPCKKHLTGRSEKKCILFTTTAEIVDGIPEFSPVKDLGWEEAAELLKELDNSGQVHTVWTFKTPYIGAICNCNQNECIFFHLKERYKSHDAIKKGHEIAFVEMELCDGCGMCLESCQFHAISIIQGKAVVNGSCYGCGVCRNFCPFEAIQLKPRY